MDKLDPQQVREAELADWRQLAQGLHARYLVPDLADAAALVAAVVEQIGDGTDHLDARLSQGAVDLSLCTREDGRWVTQTDVDLAVRISAIADEHGLEADPTAVTQLEIALDTAHEDLVSRFWSVLLTGSADNRIHDSVFDPTDRVPALWFQGTDDHDTPRQRWHFDLWLAAEVADERIAAAVSVGGTVVYDAEAPSFTVLADPEGNRVCICTAAGR